MPFPSVCVTSKESDVGCGIPVITVPTGTEQTMMFTLKDGYCPDDKPLDLREDVTEIRFIVKESMDASVFYIDKQIAIRDAQYGGVELTLSAQDLPYAGIWQAGIVIVDADGNIQRPSQFWLQVEKSITHKLRDNTPLSIVEIREFLWDRCADDNFLLDDVQFSDSQIASAITWPITQWNETPPSIGEYTTATFPWRHHWLLATASRLLRSAAYNQSRNNLKYNAAGASVNDKDKGPLYLQLAQELEQQWKEWLVHKKVEINLDLCYGMVGSPEFGGGRY